MANAWVVAKLAQSKSVIVASAASGGLVLFPPLGVSRIVGEWAGSASLRRVGGGVDRIHPRAYAGLRAVPPRPRRESRVETQRCSRSRMRRGLSHGAACGV